MCNGSYYIYILDYMILSEWFQSDVCVFWFNVHNLEGVDYHFRKYLYTFLKNCNYQGNMFPLHLMFLLQLCSN